MFIVWFSVISPGSTKGEVMIGGALQSEVCRYQLTAGEAHCVTSYSLRFGFMATRGSVEGVGEY